VIQYSGSVDSEQDDRFLQPGPETLSQLAETAEVFAADPGACLDLYGKDGLTSPTIESSIFFVIDPLRHMRVRTHRRLDKRRTRR
jgi:hypothetical protein